MNEDHTLTVIRDRLAEVRDSLGETRPVIPAAEIIGTVRRRRRRRALSAVAAVCAAAGLAVALTLPLGSQARQSVHMHLAAWSVDTNPNGTVIFRLRNTSHPARLQRALAEAGVPAMVRWGTICLAQGRHVLQPTAGIVTSVNGRPTGMSSTFMLGGGGGRQNQVLNWSWTINPSKIPATDHFVISSMPDHGIPANRVQAGWEFVPDSARVRCSTSMPF